MRCIMIFDPGFYYISSAVGRKLVYYFPFWNLVNV